MSSLRARTGVVALVLVPLLAGCAGGAPQEPAPSTTAPATGTAGPTSTDAPAATTSATDPAPAGQQAVTIDDFAFSPAELTVPLGTTVVWTNNDNAQHSITGDDGLSSPGLGQGDTYEHTFTTAGTYAYACGIHRSMRGTVVVTP